MTAYGNHREIGRIEPAGVSRSGAAHAAGFPGGATASFPLPGEAESHAKSAPAEDTVDFSFIQGNEQDSSPPLLMAMKGNAPSSASGAGKATKAAPKGTPINPRDQEMLGRAIAAEAQGEPFDAQVGVAATIANYAK